jgi:hypothetical protein
MIPADAARQLVKDGQDMAFTLSDYTEAQVSHMLIDLASQLEQRTYVTTLTGATYMQVVNEIAARQRAFITGRRT